MEPVHPMIVGLQARVFANRLDMPKVLRRAKVGRATWWRWVKRDGDPRLNTLDRISRAIDEMIAEQTPTPEETTHG